MTEEGGAGCTGLVRCTRDRDSGGPPCGGWTSASRPAELPMRAWTVDADDIQIADDLDAALLHRTPWIESFLEAKRSDRFISPRPGFGKTCR